MLCLIASFNSWVILLSSACAESISALNTKTTARIMDRVFFIAMPPFYVLYIVLISQIYIMMILLDDTYRTQLPLAGNKPEIRSYEHLMYKFLLE